MHGSSIHICIPKLYQFLNDKIKLEINKIKSNSVLDKIIKFSINNKIVIGVMTLLLIIWGSWSATRLPIDAVPDITNNQVQIITVCPTLAGQEVEQLVTFPIEQSIANIPNIEETRSISRFGLSVITVVFKENVDVYFARQLITEKLKEASEEIPKGVGTPELSPVSTGGRRRWLWPAWVPCGLPGRPEIKCVLSVNPVHLRMRGCP